MSILVTLRVRAPLVILALGLLISGCDSSDHKVSEDQQSSAEILPAINPAFDSISEVANSTTADGPYSAVSDFSYEAATETITLAVDSVPQGGGFISVTGNATIGGATHSYTVYTFVATNTDRVAANELTSLAVGHVAEGTAADFAAGVAQVAADTMDVDSADITSPYAEADRPAGLRASMIAVSNTFENAGFVPGVSSASAVNAEVEACMALGGVAYDNWSNQNAGGTGMLPMAEPNKDYLRCKACHGWDGLGTDGGYARRSRTETRPNAGYQDPDTVSRNISGGPVSLDMILHAGTGRSWAEGSAIFEGTDPGWRAGTRKGNEHPDLSASGMNHGEVPSADQLRCLTAFLNYPDARADRVFASVNPNPAAVPDWCTSAQCVDYTLVATADATRGKAWYEDPDGGNCWSCHGEPEDAVGPVANKPAGGLLAYLRADGKYSEFRHKAQWGQSGSVLMTRDNMSNPTAADIADVLAFLKNRIDGLSGQPVAVDDSASTQMDVSVDINVLNNDSDSDDPLTVTGFDSVSANFGIVSCTGSGICTYTPPVGFTGTDTFGYTITGGLETDSATVTVTVTGSGSGGNVAAGRVLYDADCAFCHAAGAHDPTDEFGFGDLGGRGTEMVNSGRLTNDLGSIDNMMAGIMLTDQQVLDMAAFLDTL